MRFTGDSVLNRIRAEGMRLAAEIAESEEGDCGMGIGIADAIRAKVAELENCDEPKNTQVS